MIHLAKSDNSLYQWSQGCADFLPSEQGLKIDYFLIYQFLIQVKLSTKKLTMIMTISVVAFSRVV